MQYSYIFVMRIENWIHMGCHMGCQCFVCFEARLPFTLMNDLTKDIFTFMILLSH